MRRRTLGGADLVTANERNILFVNLNHCDGSQSPECYEVTSRLFCLLCLPLKERLSDGAEREAFRHRLLSSVNCKWISLNKSDDLFCRTNGRLYRVKQGQDERWSLFRVASIDDQKGALLGQYSARGEAKKVAAKIAFEPEPRW